MPLLASCVALFLLPPHSSISVRDITAKNQPARDVWVFRSVLDKHARIATLAIAPGYWLSYDATTCGIFKFWHGDVKFNGAVYTTVHGPQPTSEGGAFEEGSLENDVWKLAGNGDTKLIKPQFRGYSFDLKDRTVVSFQYDLKVGGQNYEVFETPQLLWNSGKPVGLRRRFYVTLFSQGIAGRSVNHDKALSLKLGKSNGILKNFKITGGSYGLTKGFHECTITETTCTVDAFFDDPASSAQAEPYQAELFASISAQGGGNQAKGDTREKGLAYRAYQLDRALMVIPRLVPNQTPNINKKIDQIAFADASDFGIKDKFYINITGWIKIAKAGAYQFRLGSDDGSRLFINDQKVVENDGIHEATSKEGTTELAIGSHPIRVEYFNNTPDEFLQLEWKKPGDSTWELVPEEVFETIADEVHVINPGFKKVIDALFPQRPGDGRPETSVHPSFDLTTPRPKDFNPKVGGMDFYPDGRMLICTWDPDGAVYEISGTMTGDPSKVKIKRIATGLAEPLGIKIVGKDIYIAQKQEITRLRDLDGDGTIDEYYSLANGWGVTSNFHEFTFGLVEDKGFLFANLAIGIDAGGRSTAVQNKERGRVIKVNIKTGDYEFVVAGLRTPNGIAKNQKGEIFITDNQGDWLPACKLIALKPGAFYGNRSVDPDGMKNVKDTLPAVWFPEGEIGNSTSQPAPFEYGPYKGQMIVGDVTHGGLKRVFLEKIDGQYQGTAFRMTQGLEAGINRVVVGPDKAIYVGGIGSTGNWGQEGKERYGLQRLAYNGKTTFEMLAVRPMKNGAEIEFTEPIKDNGLPLYLSDYYVDSYTFVPENTYGGPKVDEKQLAVKSVSVSKDRKKLFLEFTGEAPNRILYFKMPSELQSASGELMWSTEAWTTVNLVPNRSGSVSPVKSVLTKNTLSAEEKAQGFQFLFDGSTMNAFRGYKRKDIPKGWVIADDIMAYVPGVEGGDLITKEQFGDFDLRLEWKIAEGGNSGVIYHVMETKNATFETGMEMQVLDDARHGDGKNSLTSAGSAYALYAPSQKVVLQANEWNSIRILSKGNHVEHWMNGVKILEYEKDSVDWKERVSKSKYKDWNEFGKYSVGHIAFQDHGDVVAYRNIRIRKL